MIPKANPQFPQSRAIIGPQLSWSCTLTTTFSPRFHHLLTTVLPAGFSLPRPPIAKISADKPNKAKYEPGTHHNSPQTPKTRFIHNKVVRPQLLTLLCPRETLLP
jgi:hypothetical protein